MQFALWLCEDTRVWNRRKHGDQSCGLSRNLRISRFDAKIHSFFYFILFFALVCCTYCGSCKSVPSRVLTILGKQTKITGAMHNVAPLARDQAVVDDVSKVFDRMYCLIFRIQLPYNYLLLLLICTAYNSSLHLSIDLSILSALFMRILPKILIR